MKSKAVAATGIMIRHARIFERIFVDRLAVWHFGGADCSPVIGSSWRIDIDIGRLRRR